MGGEIIGEIAGSFCYPTSLSYILVYSWEYLESIVCTHESLTNIVCVLMRVSQILFVSGEWGEDLGVQGFPREAVRGGHSGRDGVSGHLPDTVQHQVLDLQSY